MPGAEPFWDAGVARAFARALLPRYWMRVSVPLLLARADWDKRFSSFAQIERMLAPHGDYADVAPLSDELWRMSRGDG